MCEADIVACVVVASGSGAVGADTSCLWYGLSASEANLLLGSEGTEVVIGADAVGVTTEPTEC